MDPALKFLEIWSRTICSPIKRIPSESYFENIFLTSQIYLLEMLTTPGLEGGNSVVKVHRIHLTHCTSTCDCEVRAATEVESV